MFVFLTWVVVWGKATVHTIGGAIMSADGTAKAGVTTAHGELLTGSGEEYHDGLVCVDGR